MSLLGHNNGPTMEAGFAWRKHSWAKARKDLLPTLPIEVLRTRVARAKSLGLPYKTYASVRAASGHDVVGFLFSNNALRVLHANEEVPVERVVRLENVPASLMALAHPPIDPNTLQKDMAQRGVEMLCAEAPHFSESWSDCGAKVLVPVRAAGLPKDGVLVIGDTGQERDWSAAAKLAGYLPSDRFFNAAHVAP
ncbi:MAG: hypothetical protein AAGA08_06010 [Pseudomonadota bacterium]